MNRHTRDARALCVFFAVMGAGALGMIVTVTHHWRLGPNPAVDALPGFTPSSTALLLLVVLSASLTTFTLQAVQYYRKYQHTKKPGQPYP